MKHILARRRAAQRYKLAIRYLSSGLSLTEPLFNLREILKQMILLEDHLLHPSKMCSDCIHKHLLAIEAFSEEGTTLDVANGKYTKTFEHLARNAREWMEAFHQGISPAVLAQTIRQLRKKLTSFVCVSAP